MPINNQNGIDYESIEDNKKAKNADLITLPVKIDGTNCSNCKFVKIIDEKMGLGFCNHTAIKLNVTARMCCKFWDHKNAKRSWETK